MSQEEAPVAGQVPAEQAIPSATPASGADGTASPGGTAGPLVMGGAGLLAGAAAWLVLELSYPWFSVSQELLDRIPLSFPPAHLLEEFAAAQQRVNLMNASAAGLLMGVLAGALFALAQVAAGGSRRSYLHVALGILCGGAVGAVAGLTCQLVLVRLLHATEPLTAALICQIVFWALLGGGVGAAAGIAAARRDRVLGLAIQGVLAGAVFGLIYAPVAAFVFAVDDAERLVPASLANRTVWAVLGMSVVGLLLGSVSRRRRHTQTEPAA
jgi:hypothetical protein